MTAPSLPVRRGIWTALLLIAVIMAGTGHLDAIINVFGLENLAEGNQVYLQESFDESVKGFIILSGLKAGLAVLEGSEIGVGFNLEIGDMVQSIYDYVDIAWKTALAGGTVLLLMRLLLEVIQTIDHWFLFAALCALSGLYISSWAVPGWKGGRQRLREASALTITLVIALYIILPISIAGARFLSVRITRPLVADAREGFETVERELTPHALNRRMFPDSVKQDETLLDKLDVSQAVNKGMAALARMGLWLKKVTSDMAVWTIKLIAGYAFDCIIFPLAFALMLYVLTRGILVYAFGLTRKQSMRDELHAILSAYFKPKQREQMPAVSGSESDDASGTQPEKTE